MEVWKHTSVRKNVAEPCPGYFRTSAGIPSSTCLDLQSLPFPDRATSRASASKKPGAMVRALNDKHGPTNDIDLTTHISEALELSRISVYTNLSSVFPTSFFSSSELRSSLSTSNAFQSSHLIFHFRIRSRIILLQRPTSTSQQVDKKSAYCTRFLADTRTLSFRSRFSPWRSTFPILSPPAKLIYHSCYPVLVKEDPTPNLPCISG